MYGYTMSFVRQIVPALLHLVCDQDSSTPCCMVQSRVRLCVVGILSKV